MISENKQKCIFCDIINKRESTFILYEDDKIIVIKNKYPSAPVHLLCIPKQHIEWQDKNLANRENLVTRSTPNKLNKEKQLLIGHLVNIANKMAYKNKIHQACKFIFNVGKVAHFPHIHLHLIGGWDK